MRLTWRNKYNIDSKALVAKEKLVIPADPVKSSYVFLEGHKNLTKFGNIGHIFRN